MQHRNTVSGVDCRYTVKPKLSKIYKMTTTEMVSHSLTGHNFDIIPFKLQSSICMKIVYTKSQYSNSFRAL